MRFIAGPRQVGKTTLVRAYLREKSSTPFYYNWDKREVRTRYRQDPYFFHADILSKKIRRKQRVAFDEIHKFPKWKNLLKDYFDSFENRYQFIITGSARLDLFRKSGDSLSGRYFLFRLLPLTLAEVTHRKMITPSQNATHWIESSIHGTPCQEEMEQLIRFSGFPEPFQKARDFFSSHWHEEYIDSLIKEDLRDLTRIHDLEKVAQLIQLLPERIGSPLSINSLMRDLETNYNTMKSYVNSLILTYILFELKPYTKKISRAVKKEKKVYFFNWSLVKEPAKRFENYLAVELKNRAEFWSTLGSHKFELYYIRSRDGRETDFLMTQDNEPFFLVEGKLSETEIATHNLNHAKNLNVPIVQLIEKPNVVRALPNGAYVVSAARFF